MLLRGHSTLTAGTLQASFACEEQVTLQDSVDAVADSNTTHVCCVEVFQKIVQIVDVRLVLPEITHSVTNVINASLLYVGLHVPV